LEVENDMIGRALGDGDHDDPQKGADSKNDERGQA